MMDELVQKLNDKIGKICIDFYFLKKANAIEEGEKLAKDIQEFTISLLQGIAAQESTEENTILQRYVIEVLKDYTEAVARKDIVLMVDTLDFGLRELLDIFSDGVNGEDDNG